MRCGVLIIKLQNKAHRTFDIINSWPPVFAHLSHLSVRIRSIISRRQQKSIPVPPTTCVRENEFAAAAAAENLLDARNTLSERRLGVGTGLWRTGHISF